MYRSPVLDMIIIWNGYTQEKQYSSKADGRHKSLIHEKMKLKKRNSYSINPLKPNDAYRRRTAPLTSKVAFYIFIQQIWVLNILNMVYTLRFSSSKCSLFHNSNVFGSCIIHILCTGCVKIKKKIIPVPKG